MLKRWMTASGTRLFLTYAIASLIPVALLGGILMWHDNRTGTELALRQAEEHANVIMQMAISPTLDKKPLSEGLTWQERDKLWDATNLSVYTGSVAAIRLRSFDGAVIFADNNARSDLLPADSPDFQQAANGKAIARIVPHPYDAQSRTVRVLQPIIPMVTGQSTGVMQLYLPYDSVAESITRQQRETQAYLAGGLGVLYIILAGISWSTTWRLRNYAAQQEHTARYDALTDVPNRSHFQEKVNAALESDEPGAVVVADLDRFKEVNDTAGHLVGDKLLKIVAQRMSQNVRNHDVVGRIGGDEFGLLLPDVTSADAATAVLQRVSEALQAPIRIDDLTLHIGASFGVALFPAHGHDLTTVLHLADVAMYHGKRGENSIIVWSPQLSEAPDKLRDTALRRDAARR